jgi:hypothetical protein
MIGNVARSKFVLIMTAIQNAATQHMQPDVSGSQSELFMTFAQADRVMAGVFGKVRARDGND